MDAFSPNTAAFLNSLLTQDSNFPYTNQNVKTGPQSLPPSAFFNMPVPGRDTPEDTPESSHQASESPDRHGAVLSDSDDEKGVHRKGGQGRKDSGAGMHKRKAGGHVLEHDDEDDDSDSDAPGHEDKRAHPNDKAGTVSGSGRRGGRKSVGEGGKEGNKAARRKEQNRAAQKAFRERREAKVKDLEDKIAALESKSQGAVAENENLRGILKRLQEENVALKQKAFTFTMPVGGSGTATPINNMMPQPDTVNSGPKPPTPPRSIDENLRSIHDAPSLPHRGSSGMSESSSSFASGSAGPSPAAAKQPSFDNAQLFNAFAMGVRPEWERDLPANQAATAAALGQSAPIPPTRASISPTNGPTSETIDPFAAFTTPSTSQSPLSTGSNGKSELDALWASFYPHGTSSILPQSTQPAAPAAQSFAGTQFAGPNTAANPYNLFAAGNTPISDKMAFRDQSAPLSMPTQQSPDWSNITEDSINEFLASLSGTTKEPEVDPVFEFGQEDDFNAQLLKLLEQSGGASPGAPFNLPPNNNGFSPGAYLNLSPSPITSSHSPASQAALSSFSNSASPESSASSQPSHNNLIPDAAVKIDAKTTKPGEVVHVVGKDGKVLKPSELWVMMGMQHSDNVDHLVIDDLCDQMKHKATCTDTGYQINVEDAAHMFKYRNDPSARKTV